MLIERGTNLKAQDQNGCTPLHLALTKASWIQILPQQRAEIFCILLEHGADVTTKDEGGTTPLDLVSSDWQNTEVAEVFLQHRATPDSHENMV